MSAMPWYYPIFLGQDRSEIIDTLGSNAFKMTAAQIVEALLDTCYTPDVLDPSREMLPLPGVTTTVKLEGRTFLVSVDDAGGMIGVQEVTDEAYLDE